MSPLLLLLLLLLPPATAIATLNATAQHLLEKLLLDALETTLLVAAASSPDERAGQLAKETHALGPGFLECVSAGEEVFFRREFGLSRRSAVSLRSLSKVLAASGVLALQERGLVDLSASVADELPRCAGVAGATLAELLAMGSLGLDGRARAAQFARRKRNGLDAPDAVGFPPRCDELGLNPVRCVDEFLCPLLRAEDGDMGALEAAGVSREELEGAPDETCPPVGKKMRKKCLKHARKGNCEHHAGWMAVSGCLFACPGSPCNDTAAVEKDTTKRWEYSYDEATDRIVKRQNSFVYDNYAYTMADAYVFKKTGRFLSDHVRELIFEPLGMRGSIKCIQRGESDTCDATAQSEDEDFKCLAPPRDVNEWAAGEFARWRGGLMTNAWVSNAFFGSAEDISRFLGMLLRNGTLPNGQGRVLSKESVDYIFQPRTIASRPFDSCVGTQVWGTGVGYCIGKEAYPSHPFMYSSNTSHVYPGAPGVSMCSSEDTWTWGSSHGSRFSLLRDKNVACVVILNSPNRGEYPSRSHFIGHNMSAILRDVFPKQSLH